MKIQHSTVLDPLFAEIAKEKGEDAGMLKNLFFKRIRKRRGEE